MSLSKNRRCLIATMSILSPLLCAAQQAGVNFISFQAVEGMQTFPTSVNDSMTVAGYFINQIGATEGFFRNADGAVTTFMVSASTVTSPISINAANVIAGNFNDGFGDFSAFVRYASGSIATFSPGGKYPGFTYVAGINKEGVIVGDYGATDGLPPIHGFIRSVDGTILPFDVRGSDKTQPVAINAAGEIAGIYWFGTGDIYRGGFVRSADGNITTYPGIPQGINSEGDIAGWFLLASGFEDGFVRFPKGPINSFGFASPVFFSQYMGISEDGSIFGNILPPNSQQAFLRSADGTITPVLFPGASDTTAASINDSNVITGNYSQGRNVFGFLRIPQADQPQ
jgi:hypothetical protein